MENSNLPDKATKSLLVNEQFEPPNSAVETSNIPESQNHLQETMESEDSAEIEDVKVCDICGDAGLEELLAICSRCSDGAEHTYCMQKKLKELPDGDWLCEECKFKQDTGNQNVVTGAFGVQHSTKSNQNTKSDSEEKGGSERPQSPQIFSKKEANSLEVDLKSSKRGLESNSVSTRITDAKNKSLSHEGLFSNLGADKAKQVKPSASSVGQCVNSSNFARSQTFSGSNSSKMFDPFQSSRGPLSKSVSFNSSNMKPKVQFIESIPPHKQNMSRESNNTRKGQVKRLSESASFKSIRSGGLNAESIIKIQSLHPPHTGDHRGLEERNMVEKGTATPESSHVSPTPVAMDPEVCILTESKVLNINRGSQDKDNSGCNDGKPLYVPKSFECSSSNQTAQKPCQPVQEEDVHEVSDAADSSCSILNASSQRSAPRVVEFLRGNDKMKDATLSGISKEAASGGSGLLRCRKCNETGHPTQFCPIYKPPVSVLKPSADQSVRNHHNKSNKIKDAADAPVLKSIIQKDSILPNYSEKASIPSAHSGYEVPSKDLLSGSSSCLRNLVHLQRTTCGQDSVRSSFGDPSKRAGSVDVNLQAGQVEASCVPRENNLNPIVTTSDQLNTKSLQQVSPNTAFVPADRLRPSVIPQLEFIWQGGFEVLRSGRLLKYCEGVQAHLSTYASPKVLEAATKFPCKVQLEEVTYPSSWPCQYQGHMPGEHNIALFFFAKDIESYEKNYSKLLENMIKNDLALKGNIAGAEFLIFPSNKLPQNSQRWNRLFFLWGVFIRRPNFSETRPPLHKPLEAGLNSEMLVQDLPIPIREASVSPKLNYNEIPDTRVSIYDKLKEVKSAICENFHSTSPSGPQMNAILSYYGVENKAASLQNFGLEGRKVDHLRPEEKMEKGSFIKSDDFWGNDPCDRLIDVRPNSKRPLPTSMETISQCAEVTSRCSGETTRLNEKVEFPRDDDRREHKKVKPESGSHVSCSHQEENFGGSLSSKIHPFSASFSSHSLDKEAMVPGSSSIDEGCLFPVGPGLVRDMMCNEVIQSSHGNGLADSPSLELALGAKKKLPEVEVAPPPSLNTGDDMAGSLSLSLAFHSSEKEPKAFRSL